MATIEVPISDDKIMELLREKYGFDPDPRLIQSVDVTHQPPTANTPSSHTVSVQLDFDLGPGDVESLVGH